VSFLVHERKLDAPYRKPKLQSEEVVSECRNWSLERWRKGHNHVFHNTPYVVTTVPIVQNPASPDVDSDESE
jgi:hypothetical protein